MQKYQVVATLTEPMLGTVSLNEDIYRDFIATRYEKEYGEPLSNGQLEQEIATLQEVEQKGMTGFHRVDDQPILYDYLIKGFFKHACGMLWRVSDSRSKKLKAYRKIIDGLVFVFPRRIPIETTEPITILERPLRASTAQGERVALAASEMVAAGSRLTFTVQILDDKTVPQALLEEWLDYGALSGLGQWRNAGWGRFTYSLEAL